MALSDTSSTATLFDAVCRIARTLFAVPHAFVCLEDGTYRGDGRPGVPPPEADLAAALGEHWPYPRTVLLVEDARRDPILASHPLVASPSGIRFFAAAPILGGTDTPVGVLCLSDDSPRSVTQEDRDRLSDLVEIAQSHLREQIERRELTAEAALFRTLAENSADTLVRGEIGGVRSYLSPSLESLLGFTPHELVGSRAGDYVHPDDLAEFRASMREIQEGRTDNFTTEHRHRRKDGSWVWLEAFVQVTFDPVTGEQDGYVASVRGTARRKELEARLEHDAMHDVLTGLPNRALIYERLEREIARTADRDDGFAVFCLDLDGFKQVNDRFGHGAGDAVLQEVAGRLRTCVRGEDTVGRRGGDEFVAMQFAGGRRGPAITLAEKMIRAVSAPTHVEGVPANIGLSVGIAFVPTAGADAETVLRAADTALYVSKQAGRNRYSIFEAG